jgi:uncharacterized membrane protein YdbT with pleckstrin-like domain
MIDVEAHENIIIEVRKHWWALWEELAVVIFLFFIPIVISTVVLAVPAIVDAIPGDPTFLLIGVIVAWGLCMWIAGFMLWTEYYLDIWLVTDQKLVSVDQAGIFSRQISTLQLNKVQDVTVEVRGIIGTFLRYGDVKIQNAGEVREFIMHKVANPSDVELVINRAIEEYDRDH